MLKRWKFPPLIKARASSTNCTMGNLATQHTYIQSMRFQAEGSRWRAIRAKKSPCEGWLRFLVGQKRSSSRLVSLKSRPMSPPAYFLHLSFMKMSISCMHVFIEVYRIR
jgi:hypothetical protein